MTIQELNKLYYIRCEIKVLKRRIETLHGDYGVGGLSLDGMPKGKGKTDSIQERLTLKIADLEELLHKKQLEAIDEEKRLSEYIFSIDNAKIRTIMLMRFIELESWYEIAAELSIQRNRDVDRSTPQKMLKKYLERLKNESTV